MIKKREKKRKFNRNARRTRSKNNNGMDKRKM